MLLQSMSVSLEPWRTRHTLFMPNIECNLKHTMMQATLRGTPSDKGCHLMNAAQRCTKQ